VSGYNQATTGNFTIKAPVDANAKVVEGTFDITFEVGAQKGEFTGSFSAPICPNATDMPLQPMYCE
jgi:hypothetical protein